MFLIDQPLLFYFFWYPSQLKFSSVVQIGITWPPPNACEISYITTIRKCKNYPWWHVRFEVYIVILLIAIFDIFSVSLIYLDENACGWFARDYVKTESELAIDFEIWEIIDSFFMFVLRFNKLYACSISECMTCSFCSAGIWINRLRCGSFSDHLSCLVTFQW